jgi:hypothetical protein
LLSLRSFGCRCSSGLARGGDALRLSDAQAAEPIYLEPRGLRDTMPQSQQAPAVVEVAQF